VIAALLLLAQITPVQAEPVPVETTIAAILANPKKFDGQIVRIHGYVNKCETASCNIDERAANAPLGPGESLSIAKDPKFDSTVRPILPTYVEFDARVDAACILAPCLDRGSALTIVSLRGVVSPEPPPFEKP
jgi:hypothetical protein